MFKKANRTLLLGYSLLALCGFSLIFVNDLSGYSRGQWLVALLGASGALWTFKLVALAFAIGLLFMIRNEHISRRKIDRYLKQKTLLDNKRNRNA